MSDEPETKSTPLEGSVIDTNWVDMETMIAEVEMDGETWYETYKFEIAEKTE